MSIMRIGTWNLEGKWSDRHARFMHRQDCDIWLLTEVHVQTKLQGYKLVTTESKIPKLPRLEDRHWSAILTARPLSRQEEPHATTVSAIIDGNTYWCSVLPWRTCGSEPPWAGSTHAEKMAAVLGQLETARPAGRLVWGGDWNQALVGRDYAGSNDGRRDLLASIDRLKLQVPTAGLGHRKPRHASIDHIAIPHEDLATRVERLPVEPTLSDHDAYVVDFDPGVPLVE